MENENIIQMISDLMIKFLKNFKELDMMTLADSFKKALYINLKHVSPVNRILKFAISDGNKSFECKITMDQNGEKVLDIKVKEDNDEK